MVVVQLFRSAAKLGSGPFLGLRTPHPGQIVVRKLGPDPLAATVQLF